MKVVLLRIAMAGMAILSAFPAFSRVEMNILSGIDEGPLKSTIEANASRVLDEFNSAYAENRALRLDGIVQKDYQPSIEMLWENVKFRTEDQYIEEILLNTNSGYQTRNIAMELRPEDADLGEDTYKEAVLNFDKYGNVTSVYFSIESQMYKSLMKAGEQLSDLRLRMMILDYVEHFRTSYNQRDLKFLNQVFSEDALIITGNVVQTKKSDISLSLPKITYKTQTKEEYLKKLATVFKINRYINVEFEDVKIQRHGLNPNIYGVTVRQKWSTSRYSDDGYVFMVWDFSNQDRPQIHVRTWQPAFLDKGNTQPLPEEEIFDLNSFDGI